MLTESAYSMWPVRNQRSDQSWMDHPSDFKIPITDADLIGSSSMLISLSILYQPFHQLEPLFAGGTMTMAGEMIAPASSSPTTGMPISAQPATSTLGSDTGTTSGGLCPRRERGTYNLLIV